MNSLNYGLISGEGEDAASTMMVKLGVDEDIPGRLPPLWNQASQTNSWALGVNNMWQVCLSLMKRALQGQIWEATMLTAADAPSSCCG